MVERCCNPSCACYERYGGRGIKVHPAWRESFQQFYDDVGPRPSAAYSLDRIDNNGNYEPGNVRWATVTEQQNNMRSNRILDHNGKSQTVTQWARELGLQATTLSTRLRRGWTVERAIAQPLEPHFPRSGSDVPDGGLDPTV